MAFSVCTRVYRGFRHHLVCILVINVNPGCASGTKHSDMNVEVTIVSPHSTIIHEDTCTSRWEV